MLRSIIRDCYFGATLLSALTCFACSSKAGSAAGPGNAAGNSAAGGGSSSDPATGVPATGGQGGTAGLGGTRAAGPSSCSGLVRDATIQTYFTPPDTSTYWDAVGTYDNGTGLLFAIHFDRTLRLVAVKQDGSTTELLNETEYRAIWTSGPSEIMAYPRSDGVDLLVSDNNHVAIIHKQGTTVTVTSLEESSYMDLHALGLAPTASGLLALYWSSKEHTLTVYDVATKKKSTRVLHDSSSLLGVMHSTGAWLTAERLNLAADCQDTGQTVSCAGGFPPVPSYACNWHLDVWNVTDTSVSSADPLATLDVPATISPWCNDTTPAGLATYRPSFGWGTGFELAHAVVLDPSSQALAVALYQDVAATPGVRFEMLDLSGKRLINGTTTSLLIGNELSWMTVLANHVFICGGDHCSMSDAATASAFKFPYQSDTVDPRGTVITPDGVGLVGESNGNTAQIQQVHCTP